MHSLDYYVFIGLKNLSFEVFSIGDEIPLIEPDTYLKAF